MVSACPGRPHHQLQPQPSQITAADHGEPVPGHHRPVVEDDPQRPVELRDHWGGVAALHFPHLLAQPFRESLHYRVCGLMIGLPREWRRTRNRLPPRFVHVWRAGAWFALDLRVRCNETFIMDST